MLVDVPHQQLASAMGFQERKAQDLQETLQRVLDRREEERQSKELLQLYLNAVAKEREQDETSQAGMAQTLYAFWFFQHYTLTTGTILDLSWKKNLQEEVIVDGVGCTSVFETLGGAVGTVKSKHQTSHSHTSGAAAEANLTEVDSATGFMSRTLMVLKGKTNPETRLSTMDLQVLPSNCS